MKYKTSLAVSLALALFLAGCGPAPAPQATSQPSPTASECIAGSHLKQIVSVGEPRSYILHVPPSYAPGKPAALVLGFHGNNGRPEQFEAYSGFSSLADREGFIAAYPLGAGAHPTWTAWQGGKDVEFTSELIDKISAICNIDPARIYATGHSLGGGMVNRLACDLSKRTPAPGRTSFPMWRRTAPETRSFSTTASRPTEPRPELTSRLGRRSRSGLQPGRGATAAPPSHRSSCAKTRSPGSNGATAAAAPTWSCTPSATANMAGRRPAPVSTPHKPSGTSSNSTRSFPPPTTDVWPLSQTGLS